jgi:hypothetical protein
MMLFYFTDGGPDSPTTHPQSPAMNGTDSAADESCAEVAIFKLNNGRIATTAKIAKRVHGHIVTVPEVQRCLNIARIKV